MHLSSSNWGIYGQEIAPVCKLHPDLSPDDKIDKFLCKKTNEKSWR